ncbi:MAG: FHA domain-containing protein [Desulfosarcina sp.]|jgi:hypothetical protein
MALLSIELSDVGIIAAGGTPAALKPVDGQDIISPGFALQKDRRLLVGRRAAQQARLFPQQIVSQFWDRLDTQPLRQKGFTATNHAELAYTHLKQICSALPMLENQFVFCVPGHYRRRNLGLLLGITRELNMPVQGFVPIALTAVDATDSREIIYLDLHLHRCEVSYLKRDTELVLMDSDTISDAGLERLHRIWAKSVAREFLKATRFDLFHSAASEQEVSRNLAALLASLTDHQTTRFELDNGTHNYHITLQRKDMIEAARPVYDQIADLVTAIVERNACADRSLTIQLSSRACGLPGLNDVLTSLVPGHLRERALGAAALGALDCWPALSDRSAGRGPARHMRRAVVQTPTGGDPDTASDGAQPTHVLLSDRAYPIGQEPLVIGSSPGTGAGVIQLTGRQISAKHCSVNCDGRQVFIDNHSPHGTQVDGVRVQNRTTLIIGQTITVGDPGVSLRLIQCLQQPV